MSVTIELNSDMESQLRAEAAKHGVDADAYIVKTLRESLENFDVGNSCLQLNREGVVNLRRLLRSAGEHAPTEM